MTTATLQTPLREVRLYGALGRQFGRLFRLAVATPAEALLALRCVLPGFERAFVGADGRAKYYVFVGRGAQRRSIDYADATAPVGVNEPIRIVPEVVGAARGGLFQTLIGIVLIVVGSIYNQPELMKLGLALALGGVVQLLSPQRRKQDPDKTVSYAFDGPVNNVEQGGPVPVILGRAVCGSTVVSQGLRSEEVVLGEPDFVYEVPEVPPDFNP